MRPNPYQSHDVDRIHNAINVWSTESTLYPLRMGLTDSAVSKQISAHKVLRKPWYLTAAASGGRSIGDRGNRNILKALLTSGGGLVLFPAHYDLIVADVDTPTVDLVATDCPGWLHRSYSRSHYGYTVKPSGSGHLWYVQPRTLSYLSSLPTNPDILLAGRPHRIDLLHSKTLFIPPQEVAATLEWLARYCVDGPPANSISCYQLFAARHRDSGHRRNDALWRYLCDLRDQGGKDAIDVDTWYAVAEDIGHVAKHGEERTRSLIDRAKGITSGESNDEEPRLVQPMTQRGFRVIVRDLSIRLRYNLRLECAEIRTRQGRWLPVEHEPTRIALLSHIYHRYDMPRGKGTTGWDGTDKWRSIGQWCALIGLETDLHDPVESYIARCRDADPMDDTDSLLLRLMRSTVETDQSIRDIQQVERAILLAQYARITAFRDGIKPPHFPHMPVLIGPGGIGKSRYCRELAIDGQYHTADARFDDPPKVFAEKYRANIVVELPELAEMLGTTTDPRTSKIRGNAKAYIEQTEFTFRAAYAAGSTATNHRTGGILLGTSNDSIDIERNDGLWRRLVPLLLTRHPDMIDDFDAWSDIVDANLCRALRRAQNDWEAGRRPQIPAAVIDRLHAQRLNNEFSNTI